MRSSLSKISVCICVSTFLVAGLGLLVRRGFAEAVGENPFAWVGKDWSSHVQLERSWPSSAEDPAVRAEITRHSYTERELGNIQTTLERLSGTGRARDPGRWRSIHLISVAGAGKGGFYVLHEFFGRPERNGWFNPGFANQKKTVEDIIAKGDRVAVIWRITGNINGPFFGFPGYGQVIETREQSISWYDDEGKVQASIPWSGEDLVLYEQLGGRIDFPESAAKSIR